MLYVLGAYWSILDIYILSHWNKSPKTIELGQNLSFGALFVMQSKPTMLQTNNQYYSSATTIKVNSRVN